MLVEIEELRAELKEKVQMTEKDFLHDVVVNLSQELDKLIVKKMKSYKN